ncbi:MAG: alpha/beta hydrolase-fold protein [Bacteroidota bacterium]
MYDSLQSFQTLQIGKHLVDIALPKESVTIKGNLLILQGFNFPKDDWCKKSSLCKKALAEGYVLIMPEMGKSVYATKLYPETREDWRHYPTKTWLVDTVFSHLQEKYGLLLSSQQNYMIGLSTGARGIALVALDHPTLFTACAALSGDYDPTRVPNDRLITAYYGAYELFPTRWAQVDNVVAKIEEWRTPIYLGHGKRDKVVAWEETQWFYDQLIQQAPEFPVKLSLLEIYGHDYTYWDFEVDRVLDFFDTIKP